MSELDPVWCVEGNRFWHATDTGRQWNRVRAFVKTACGQSIMPVDFMECRLPDCLDCQDTLLKRHHAKAVLADDETQAELF